MSRSEGVACHLPKLKLTGLYSEKAPVVLSDNDYNENTESDVDAVYNNTGDPKISNINTSCNRPTLFKGFIQTNSKSINYGSRRRYNFNSRRKIFFSNKGPSLTLTMGYYKIESYLVRCFSGD